LAHAQQQQQNNNCPAMPCPERNKLLPSWLSRFKPCRRRLVAACPDRSTKRNEKNSAQPRPELYRSSATRSRSTTFYQRSTIQLLIYYTLDDITCPMNSRIPRKSNKVAIRGLSPHGTIICGQILRGALHWDFHPGSKLVTMRRIS
jgi:hypothetical protein